MTQLLKSVWQICLLREGPQVLPFSLGLLAFLVVSTIALGWAQLWWQNASALPLMESFVLIAVTMLFSYTVLRFKSVVDRYVQTTTALLATSVVVTFIIWPIVNLMIFVMKTHSQTSFAFMGANLFVLILVVFANIWSLLIVGHIFRHAIGSSYLIGLLLALLMIGLHSGAYQLLH